VGSAEWERRLKVSYELQLQSKSKAASPRTQAIYLRLPAIWGRTWGSVLQCGEAGSSAKQDATASSGAAQRLVGTALCTTLFLTVAPIGASSTASACHLQTSLHSSKFVASRCGSRTAPFARPSPRQHHERVRPLCLRRPGACLSSAAGQREFVCLDIRHPTRISNSAPATGDLLEIW
jgi:hypothetical protein